MAVTSFTKVGFKKKKSCSEVRSASDFKKEKRDEKRRWETLVTE